MKTNRLTEEAADIILSYCSRMKSKNVIKLWLESLISVNTTLVTDREYSCNCIWVDGIPTVRQLVADCLTGTTLSTEKYYAKEDSIVAGVLAYYDGLDAE